jgi:polyhydroxyalkanoate synthesis regulator phasin
MQDAWRAYLELALGLTETSRKQARAVARKLVGQGSATASQLQTMAEELIATGVANRESLTRMIRMEIDRALSALGLANADEVAALSARIQRLEEQLREMRTTVTEQAASAGSAQPSESAGNAPLPVPTATKTVAKKAVAKKAVAKKAAGATTTRPAVKKAVAHRASGATSGGETAEKRATARKLPTPAKKTAAADVGVKTPTRKSSGRKATGGTAGAGSV